MESLCGSASGITGPSVDRLHSLPVHLCSSCQSTCVLLPNLACKAMCRASPWNCHLARTRNASASSMAQPAGRRHSSLLGHLEGCTGSAQGSALSKGLCLGTPAATRAMAKQISCQECAVSAPSWHQDCIRTASLAAALSACSFTAEVLSCSAQLTADKIPSVPLLHTASQPSCAWQLDGFVCLFLECSFASAPNGCSCMPAIRSYSLQAYCPHQKRLSRK